MKKKRDKLLEVSKRIAGLFDRLNEDIDYSGEYYPIAGVTTRDEYYERLRSLMGEGKSCDDINRIVMDVRDIAFAVGFVIGQIVEATYPKVQEDIETVKKIIKEKQLLPYLPREKKAA